MVYIEDAWHFVCIPLPQNIFLKVLEWGGVVVEIIYFM